MNVPLRVAFDHAVKDIELVLGASSYLRAVQEAVDVSIKCLHAGKKLLAFGNDEASAKAVSGTAVWIHDGGSDEDGLARQIETLGEQGDVAWAISATSVCPKVVKALKTAHGRGLKTIGLMAYGDEHGGHFCNVRMHVPLSSAARIQEVHLVTCHVICAAVQRAVADRAPGDFAACPCGHVIEVTAINHLSAYCDNCFGEFSVEEGIRRFLLRADITARTAHQV